MSGNGFPKRERRAKENTCDGWGTFGHAVIGAAVGWFADWLVWIVCQSTGFSVCTFLFLTSTSSIYMPINGSSSWHQVNSRRDEVDSPLLARQQSSSLSRKISSYCPVIPMVSLIMLFPDSRHTNPCPATRSQWLHVMPCMTTFIIRNIGNASKSVEV